MNFSKSLICALLLAATCSLHAATFIWSGGALIGSKWSNDNNWTTSAPPSNGSAALIFTGADRLDANADSAWSILSLTFNSSAGAFGIQGETLTIGSGGVSNNDNTLQTIHNDIILSASQTWDTTSTGGLNFLGALNTSNRLLTLTPTQATSTFGMSGPISGIGGVTISGAGHVNFTGVANSYTGTTTVNSATLILNKSAGVNSIVGPLVIGDGSGAFQGIVVVASPNQIANGSDVTVNTGGQLEMNESDVIDNLTIIGGTVSMSAAKSLAVNALLLTAGDISGNSGTLILNGNVTTSPSADAATIGTAVDLSALNRTFTVAASGAVTPDLTISGVIFNGGLVKTGPGTLRVNVVSNTYIGTTTVNAGTLELSKNNGQTAIPGPLVIGDGTGAGTVKLLIAEQIANTSNVTINGGVLDLNGFSETINGLTMTGGTVNSGAGSLTLGGNVTASTLGNVAPAINGKLNLGGANRTFMVNDNAAALIDLDVSALISNGGIVKDGPGTLRLSSPTGSSFAGGVSVLAGQLVVSSNTAAGSGTLLMSGGSNIRTDGAAQNLGNAVNLSDEVTIGGAFDLAFSGATQLKTNVTLNIANGGLTTFSGSIGQDATPRTLTKTGVGTLIFSGGVANTYTGTTTVSTGELRLGKSGGAAAVLGSLVIGEAVGNATVRLQAGNQISDSSTVTIAAGASLELNGFNETIGALNLNGGKIGDAPLASILTLGGSVTIKGTNASHIFSAIDLGGALRSFTVGNSDADPLAVDLTTHRFITNGGINVEGSGTLLLLAASTFTGGLSVNGGEVVFDNSLSAGLGTITLNGGAVRAAGSAVSLSNPVSLGGSSTIGGSSDLTFTGPVMIDDDHFFTINNTALTTFSGVIGQTIPQPSRSLSKNGPGTLVLSGANTFTGGFNLSAGELAVGNNAAVGTGTLKMSGGTIRASGAPRSLANAVALSGNVTIGGTFDLTFNGHTTLGSDSTLTVSNTGLTTFAAINQDSSVRSLIKLGPGTLVLSGINTYTGGTQVNQGKLISSGSLAASKGVSVVTGATFEVVHPQSIKGLHMFTGGLAVLSSTTPTFLTTHSLVLEGSAALDINQRALAINYDPGQSLLASIRSSIISGYAGGLWTGPGIRSATAAANSNFAIGYVEASDILGPTGGVFLDQNVDGDTLLIRTTLSGDANLDGTVGFADLVAVAQHYGNNSGSATWNIGDFNYDGTVGFADLVAVAQHYGGTFPSGAAIPAASAEFDHDLAGALAQVPEPATPAVLMLTACGMAFRRFRRR